MEQLISKAKDNKAVLIKVGGAVVGSLLGAFLAAALSTAMEESFEDLNLGTEDLVSNEGSSNA